jgi:hypothetical protein
VWQDLGQARQFLLDQLFRGVMESFKRPRVRNWMVTHQGYGNRALQPSHAIREIDSIPVDQDIEKLIAEERLAQQEMLANENCYYHLAAIDPDRWEILRYHLWKDAASSPRLGSDCIQTYSVLHVSEPVVMAGGK